MPGLMRLFARALISFEIVGVQARRPMKGAALKRTGRESGRRATGRSQLRDAQRLAAASAPIVTKRPIVAGFQSGPTHAPAEFLCRCTNVYVRIWVAVATPGGRLPDACGLMLLASKCRPMAFDAASNCRTMYGVGVGSGFQ